MSGCGKIIFFSLSLSGRSGYLSLSDIGYGEVTGFQGANCRHNWYMYFEGVSQRAYSPEQLREWREGTVTYNGTEMSLYDATQKQRGMERAIRKSKQELVALDELIKNTDDADAKTNYMLDFNNRSVRLKGQEAKLRDFCNKTGLDRDRYREQVFAAKTEKGLRNFGKSTSTKAVYAAKKRYENFVYVVGKENAPATLDKYYDLKYNKPEEFNKLKEIYKELHEAFAKGKLVRNANGQLIKVVSKTTLRSEPNSITQYVNSKGGIDRNYYDENGNQFKQISNNDHGHKKESTYGEHGEHGHNYVINKQGLPVHQPARELTPQERIENADIL